MDDKELIVKRSELEKIHNQLVVILHPVGEEIITASNVILSLRRLIETSPTFEKPKEVEDATDEER